MAEYYRGGNSLKPRSREVKIDRATGLLSTKRGVSVYDRPDGLDRFGGAHRVSHLPAELQVIQYGQDPHHFEIVPTRPMTLAEYEDA
jgi:hypothetical protein